ncbi:UNVERIFIED_CONTAM: hypothetical protein FKN15_014246 [Acipenser sinensis]
MQLLINVCQYHLLNKALKYATAPDHFRNTMSHSPTGGSPNHSLYSCSSTNTFEPVTAVLNSTPKHTHTSLLCPLQRQPGLKRRHAPVLDQALQAASRLLGYQDSPHEIVLKCRVEAAAHEE